MISEPGKGRPYASSRITQRCSCRHPGLGGLAARAWSSPRPRSCRPSPCRGLMGRSLTFRRYADQTRAQFRARKCPFRKRGSSRTTWFGQTPATGRGPRRTTIDSKGRKFGGAVPRADMPTAFRWCTSSVRARGRHVAFERPVRAKTWYVGRTRSCSFYGF